jgi:hypothetical protein
MKTKTKKPRRVAKPKAPNPISPPTKGGWFQTITGPQPGVRPATRDTKPRPKVIEQTDDTVIVDIFEEKPDGSFRKVRSTRRLTSPPQPRVSDAVEVLPRELEGNPRWPAWEEPRIKGSGREWQRAAKAMHHVLANAYLRLAIDGHEPSPEDILGEVLFNEFPRVLKEAKLLVSETGDAPLPSDEYINVIDAADNSDALGGDALDCIEVDADITIDQRHEDAGEDA